MQFHTFSLDKESQDECAIATPFGKCECPRLPMGFLNSPSWAQAAMDESFSHVPNVEANIDDIGTFSTNFKDHIETVDAVLQPLEQHDFSIKASKNGTGVNPRRLGWVASSPPLASFPIQTKSNQHCSWNFQKPSRNSAPSLAWQISADLLGRNELISWLPSQRFQDAQRANLNKCLITGRFQCNREAHFRECIAHVSRSQPSL